MKLSGRTILITGGSSGIGLALATQLTARGNTLIITGRDQARLDAARAALPAIHTLQSDVSDPAAIASLYAEVSAHFPALDVLINNAGIMRKILVQSAGDDLRDITREVEINLSGPIRMAQQFLPLLKAKPSAAIVNVSSGLAFVPMAIAPVYCAAKAAMHSYSRSLRFQLRDTNVRVIELAPPGTETPLFRGEFEKEVKAMNMKGMPVDELAKVAIVGIEKGRLEIRPGLSNVLKAMSRLAPDFMFKQLNGRV